uniref:Uncharacterized protein n=1 Tax=Rhabditophanes sp. KR3021 TaxID=114890 RepID=A0AC35TXG9_9BILA
MNFNSLPTINVCIEATEIIPLQFIGYIEPHTRALLDENDVGSRVLLLTYASMIFNSPDYPTARNDFIRFLSGMSIPRKHGIMIFREMPFLFQPLTIHFQRLVLERLSIDSPVNCFFWDQKLKKMFDDEDSLVLDLEKLGMCRMSLSHDSLMNVNYVFWRFLQFYYENDRELELVQTLFNEWLLARPNEPNHIVPNDLALRMQDIFLAIIGGTVSNALVQIEVKKMDLETYGGQNKRNLLAKKKQNCKCSFYVLFRKIRPFYVSYCNQIGQAHQAEKLEDARTIELLKEKIKVVEKRVKELEHRSSHKILQQAAVQKAFQDFETRGKYYRLDEDYLVRKKKLFTISYN